MMKRTIRLTVNGKQYVEEVEPRMLLVHLLRERLGLKGTHIGCEDTICGACTILMNGNAIKSCTILALRADGANITTIEGVAAEGKLHPVQEAFWEEHALECGYCTPGMVISAIQLLKRNPNPTEDDVRHGLEGNLCRCTGYQNIVKAVLSAAKKLNKRTKSD